MRFLGGVYTVQSTLYTYRNWWTYSFLLLKRKKTNGAVQGDLGGRHLFLFKLRKKSSGAVCSG